MDLPLRGRRSWSAVDRFYIMYLNPITIQHKEDVFIENSIKEIIRSRKSVRTFNGDPLRPEDKQKLEEYLKV